MLRNIKYFNNIRENLDPFYKRKEFVVNELKNIKENSKLLDAGCGSQFFKQFCNHLDYYSQDFGEYIGDEKKGFNSHSDYTYGKLDYKSDIWAIPENESTFDYILCTEVFEHIPYPIETVKEFSRLLKPGGKLILTAPSNSLRHFDPYYFYSGFSDRWYNEILKENNFKIISIEPVGDYYRWMSTEMIRTILSHGFISKIMLLPAFIYFYFSKKTETSENTLCYGYHVVAEKN